MRLSSVLPRDATRLVAAGAALAALILLGGSIAEWKRFGRTDADAVTRIAADVTRTIEQESNDLRARASVVAADAGRVARAVRGDAAAAADLFDAIEGAHPGHDSRVALTVYGPAAEAVAWSDGPAEDLPEDRITGQAALFAADGTLGLRLVYVMPVMSPDGGRAGSVAVERVLVPALGVARGTSVRELDVSLAPVQLLMRHEGAGEGGEEAGGNTFVLYAATGEVLLQGYVDPAALANARKTFQRGVLAAAGLLFALALALVAGPILDARQRAAGAAGVVTQTALALATLVAARTVAVWAIPPAWEREPAAVVFITGATLAAMAAVLAPLVARIPLGLRGRRVPSWAGLLAPALSGAVAWLAVSAYARTLDGLKGRLDLLDFALYPLAPTRLLLLLGLLLLAAATIWMAVLLFVTARHLRRASALPHGHRAPVAEWVLPALIAFAMAAAGVWRPAVPQGPALAVIAIAAVAAWLAAPARRYYRHASHAMRLLSVWLLLILPALALYPLSVVYAGRATRDVIAGDYAPRTAGHTSTLQDQLAASLARIDSLPNLPAVIASAAGGPQAAFFVWDRTPLGDSRLTSAVELYRRDGALVSRFELDLPEIDAAGQRNTNASCDWDVFGEVSRFGSEERRMLHAERGVCDATGVSQGAIVVHVMPDYRALPFVAAANPYLEVLRGSAGNGRPAMDTLEVAIYGWGLLPIFTSGTQAWRITPELFDRLYRSRDPFWTVVDTESGGWHVYLMNDRAGIYALGYPRLTAFDMFVHGAELATLAGIAWLLILAGAALFLPLARRRMYVGRMLLREIRTSFYRKLLLAFVAVAIVPVIVLALVLRAYTAGLLRQDVEEEAARTASVAQRSIENYAVQQRGESVAITDGLIVQLSQILSQDINMFEGPSLLATSERDLFTSGLLPTRTPAQVYREIALERRPSYVGEERIGDFSYLLAARPATTAGRDVIVSVPLLSRRNEIEREVQDLERGIHLAAVLFVLLGSGIGLYMAERIADPVRRLTRATRRIASGDLDARVAIRTADELRRLVDDFNQMAEDLKAQRDELSRTQRLAAWAEMARQVAHEIKNPLTPIQLSAEHLRRVHADRGEPMNPVLDQCVDSILSQVSLLRQISSEFSAFASSPTVRLADVDLGELAAETVAPYRTGLPPAVELVVDTEPALPRVRVDRTLLGRVITNLIENALHAMPSGGRLALTVRRDEGSVVLSVADSGIGMDREARERAFEPYFSTKATGTGLGLPIARRNVELNGGTISVDSARGRGTTVTVRLPVPAQ